MLGRGLAVVVGDLQGFELCEELWKPVWSSFVPRGDTREGRHEGVHAIGVRDFPGRMRRLQLLTCKEIVLPVRLAKDDKLQIAFVTVLIVGLLFRDTARIIDSCTLFFFASEIAGGRRCVKMPLSGAPTQKTTGWGIYYHILAIRILLFSRYYQNCRFLYLFC